MVNEKKVIGICVSEVQSNTQNKQIAAICRIAKQRDYYVTIYNTYDQLDHKTSFDYGEAQVFQKIPYHMIDVIILFGEAIRNRKITNNIVKHAKDENIPLISIDYQMDDCFNVLFDYEESFEKIVRHIIEFHHCKVVNFMAGFKGNKFSDDRIAIYKKVLLENGLDFQNERLSYGQFWEVPAREECQKWVEMWKTGKQTMPEAIICANDIMALTVCNVLTNNEIHVPDDILVTGFDGLELNNYCTPRITTARDDLKQIGDSIMKLVDQCAQDNSCNPYDITIPFYTSFSETCGCSEIQFCNPNEQIMNLYQKNAGLRFQMMECFMMMTELSDEYSASEMIKKACKYKNLIDIDSMLIVANHYFYSVTDLCSETCDSKPLLLLAKVENGNYTAPLTEIPMEDENKLYVDFLKKVGQVLVLPVHVQEKTYGYVLVAYEDSMRNIGGFYEYILAFEQVLGSIRRQSELHLLYITDTLTGLYNRRGFYNIMQEAVKKIALDSSTYLFLASVDMDGLKFINDNYGHAEGDYAIKTVARILQGSIKGRKGICARFGGDEYMVAIISEEKEADMDFYESYEKLLQKRMQRLERKSEKPYKIGASVGCIHCRIHQIEDVDQAMKSADDIMYKCKEKHHESRSAREKTGNL